jgi:hypothetical protein
MRLTPVRLTLCSAIRLTLCSTSLWVAATMWSVEVGADVSYVEEIVNSGIGAAKVGARKTVRNVYVKGQSQHVHEEVKSAEAVEVGTTILRLDRLNRYDIDHTSKTFTEHKLPARAAVAQQDWWQASHGGNKGASSNPVVSAAKVAPKAVAVDPNREVTFKTSALPDTMRVEGILCRRVAAQMRVRYYVPGTKQVRRENRYLYQAWVATDFPGYADIERFEAQREAKTSLPSQIGGGLGELQGAAEDYDRLDEEMKALDGFPLQSQLKVFTTTSSSSKEKELFRLSRKVSSLSHSDLSPSLFEVSSGLRRVDVEAAP